MGMTCGYGPARDRDAMISLIHRAVDLGVNFFDTAECYGPFANEELLGEALQPIRHNVFVATKFGLKSVGGRPVPDSRPESIRQSVEDSLRRLRTDHVDLLFQHRVDPRVPIEEVAETVGQLVQEGKVCHWGLSEASLNTIRRAHHILPLTAVENEYSPLWRDAERGLLALLDELDIGLVASSPIGKGLLSGQLSADMLFGKEDFRSTQPRFQPKHLAANYALVRHIGQIAARKGITPAQASLAWLLTRQPWIVPIPGVRDISHLRENIEATVVKFSPGELAELDEAIHSVTPQGDRYAPEHQALINR